MFKFRDSLYESSAQSEFQPIPTTLEDPTELARHIIEFDAKNPSTHGPWTRIEPELLVRPDDIPWPTSLSPHPQALSQHPDSSDPLPEAEIIVVTWTDSEARALADVLTPDFSSLNWYTYDRFFDFDRAYSV